MVLLEEVVDPRRPIKGEGRGMREIKFRAWDGCKMHKGRPTMMVDTSDGVIYLDDIEDHVPDWVLMQFTGLLDKNGKEIYESDVVKVYHWLNGEIEDYRTHTNKIIFDCGAFGLDSSRCYRETLQGSDVEIIGNIYENPELLI